VSKAEQRRRFLMRLHNPDKRWKFSLNDINERLRWKEYMAAYEEMLRVTSTPEAPWYVVPADNKWFTRLAVAAIAVDDAPEPSTSRCRRCRITTCAR
jgi:polyphosphate kinase 2 (PPK2 family)